VLSLFSKQSVKSLLGLSLGLLFGLALSMTAQATTRTVCSSGCDFTTIAAAIAAASEGDTIRILNVVHTEAGIVIDRNLTIEGQGAVNTIVQAAATLTTSANRVFVVNGGVTATLQSMTIRHGKVGCSTANCAASGGGILNFGQLTITDVILDTNATFCTGSPCTSYGGGIYNGYSRSRGNGTVTLNNSIITNNSARDGGGLFNDTGRIVINNSTLSYNAATFDGGSAYNTCTSSTCPDSKGSSITINNSSLIYNSVFSSSGRGAGVYNQGSNTVSVNTSLLSNNSSQGVAGVIHNEGRLNLNNSTISANSASSVSGIFNSGTANIRNSTLSDNFISCSGGCISSFGGSISNTDGGVTNISNSTFRDNAMVCSLSLCSLAGGAISNSSGTVNIKNSLIANSHNTATNCYGTLTVVGVNFSSDNSCAGFTQVTLAQLNLGPLEDNGGPTPTNALRTGSVAIGCVH
jgi:hypothetical protein